MRFDKHVAHGGHEQNKPDYVYGLSDVMCVGMKVFLHRRNQSDILKFMETHTYKNSDLIE